MPDHYIFICKAARGPKLRAWSKGLIYKSRGTTYIFCAWSRVYVPKRRILIDHLTADDEHSFKAMFGGG